MNRAIHECASRGRCHHRVYQECACKNLWSGQDNCGLYSTSPDGRPSGCAGRAAGGTSATKGQPPAEIVRHAQRGSVDTVVRPYLKALTANAWGNQG